MIPVFLVRDTANLYFVIDKCQGKYLLADSKTGQFKIETIESLARGYKYSGVVTDSNQCACERYVTLEHHINRQERLGFGHERSS